MFLLAIFAVAVLSGATAAVAGFGIGSLLTPLLALRFGTATAVALVALPHAAATALRWLRLRHAVDTRVLRSFGLLSAVGGLVGAFFYTRLSANGLSIVLGVLLIATSIAALTDWARRWSPKGGIVYLLGLLSGLFGGLAGNQGGLRAAALLPFNLSPVTYVATATATALLVDLARTPIYVWRAGAQLIEYQVPLLVATAGVLLGTLLGERLLLGMPPERFRRVIGIVIGLLGAWILAQAL